MGQANNISNRHSEFDYWCNDDVGKTERVVMSQTLPVIKILVVEDHIFSTKLIKSHLKQAKDKGFIKPKLRFVCAKTVKQAELACSVFKPDIVISDLRLPDSDGVETVKRIKGCVGDVPIIVFSGSASPDIVQECYKEGIARYLTKPLSDYMCTLSAAIITALDESLRDEKYKQLI